MATAITGFQLLSRPHRRALGLRRIERQETVAKLDGMVYREYSRAISFTTGGQTFDYDLNPVFPGYVTYVSARGSQAEGFEFQVSTDREGRMFSSPARSALYAPSTLQNISVPGRILAEPRFCSGVVRVRARNLAAGVQDCHLTLGIAELLEGGQVPAVVLAEQNLVGQAAALPADTGVASRTSDSALAAPVAGSGRLVGMTNTPLSVALSNNATELLAANMASSVEVYSLLLVLSGTWPDTLSAQLEAWTASGERRPLMGMLFDLTGGGQIDLGLNIDEPWFTLNPGERLMVNCVTVSLVACNAGGLIKSRTV